MPSANGSVPRTQTTQLMTQQVRDSRGQSLQPCYARDKKPSKPGTRPAIGLRENSAGGSRRAAVNTAIARKVLSQKEYRAALSVKRKKAWIIDPRTNTWIGYWDLVTTAALVFTAIVTPVEVAFVTKRSEPVFWLNRLVDCVFVCDMLQQFFLAYPTDVNGRTAKGKQWVLDQRRIAVHYLLSRWFLLDFFSIATSVFDVVGDDTDTSALSGLRAVRTLRLIKLVRLARTSRVFKRWEMRLTINYSYLSLTRILVGIIIACHWFACMWGLQASLGGIMQSWPAQATGSGPLCEPWGSPDQSEAELMLKGGDCPEGRACSVGTCYNGECMGGSNCVGWSQMYIYSLYWAVMTITSVGYGDIVASKFNMGEQMICAFLILLGGMLWGYLIGTFCGLAASLSPSQQAFRGQLSQLNQFMTSHNLPQQLRFRLREYIYETVHLSLTEDQNKLLPRLSGALQSEVAWTCHRAWLSNIWFLRDAEKEMQIELAAFLTAKVFAPDELCPSGVMYIVYRGIAFWAAKVVHAGGVWGDDVLIEAETLRLDFPALAMSYLWVYIIDGDLLRRMIKKYPETGAMLRKIQVRWIVRRGIVKKAEEEMSRLGCEFRGRFNNIYARDAVRIDQKGSRVSTVEAKNRRVHKRRSTMSASVQVALMNWGRKAREKTEKEEEEEKKKAEEEEKKKVEEELRLTVPPEPPVVMDTSKIEEQIAELQMDMTRLNASMDILLNRLPAFDPTYEAKAAAPNRPMSIEQQLNAQRTRSPARGGTQAPADALNPRMNPQAAATGRSGGQRNSLMATITGSGFGKRSKRGSAMSKYDA